MSSELTPVAVHRTALSTSGGSVTWARYLCCSWKVTPESRGRRKGYVLMWRVPFKTSEDHKHRYITEIFRFRLGPTCFSCLHPRATSELARASYCRGPLSSSLHPSPPPSLGSCTSTAEVLCSTLLMTPSCPIRSWLAAALPPRIMTLWG